MFGYITVNMDEMKMKDYRTYRAFYCGICHDLKEYHGQVSRLTLTYDMTFLAILLIYYSFSSTTSTTSSVALILSFCLM